MKKFDSHNYREYDDFEKLALPFQGRMYRTALILTKSPCHAKELLKVTNLNARKHYNHRELGLSFGIWLVQLLMRNYMSSIQ